MRVFVLSLGMLLAVYSSSQAGDYLSALETYDCVPIVDGMCAPQDLSDCVNDDCCPLGSECQTPACDLKSQLADRGISFAVDVTQFYLGTVNGGLEQEFRYSGHGDYVANIDVSQLGGPQGLFIKLRAEHRFGESLSGATGAILPSNLLADLPVADSQELFLTNVLFTQFLSEEFGVFFGKLDTLDGDVNAFAHGRGKTQFMNAAFVATPIALRTVVYSTLGAGFVIVQEGKPIFTFTVLNATDTATTAGFDELFAQGVALVPELRLPTNFFGLKGHQLFGASWSTRDYASLNQNPYILLPNVPIARQSDSWSLYWNFDQYLFVDPCDESKGWGVFGRAGVGDEQTNPINWFLSFGVGGNIPFGQRTNDTFGAGWFYAGTSDQIAPFVATLLGGLQDGQGVEIFYNVHVNDHFDLTADLQLLDPARSAVDNSVVLGMRANLHF